MLLECLNKNYRLLAEHHVSTGVSNKVCRIGLAVLVATYDRFICREASKLHKYYYNYLI